MHLLRLCPSQSSYLLHVHGSSLLLDIPDGADLEWVDFSSLDVILLSGASFVGRGTARSLARRLRPETVVLCTAPTAHLASYQLLNLSTQDGVPPSSPLYKCSSVSSLPVTLLSYGQTFVTNKQLQVACFPSGLSIGSCNWRIEASSHVVSYVPLLFSERVFYRYQLIAGMSLDRVAMDCTIRPLACDSLIIGHVYESESETSAAPAADGAPSDRHLPKQPPHPLDLTQFCDRVCSWTSKAILKHRAEFKMLRQGGTTAVAAMTATIPSPSSTSPAVSLAPMMASSPSLSATTTAAAAAATIPSLSTSIPSVYPPQPQQVAYPEGSSVAGVTGGVSAAMPSPLGPVPVLPPPSAAPPPPPLAASSVTDITPQILFIECGSEPVLDTIEILEYFRREFIVRMKASQVPFILLHPAGAYAMHYLDIASEYMSSSRQARALSTPPMAPVPFSSEWIPLSTLRCMESASDLRSLPQNVLRGPTIVLGDAAYRQSLSKWTTTTMHFNALQAAASNLSSEDELRKLQVTTGCRNMLIPVSCAGQLSGSASDPAAPAASSAAVAAAVRTRLPLTAEEDKASVTTAAIFYCEYRGPSVHVPGREHRPVHVLMPLDLANSVVLTPEGRRSIPSGRPYAAVAAAGRSSARLLHGAPELAVAHQTTATAKARVGISIRDEGVTIHTCRSAVHEGGDRGSGVREGEDADGSLVPNKIRKRATGAETAGGAMRSLDGRLLTVENIRNALYAHGIVDIRVLALSSDSLEEEEASMGDLSSANRKTGDGRGHIHSGKAVIIVDSLQGAQIVVHPPLETVVDSEHADIRWQLLDILLEAGQNSLVQR